MRVPLLPDGRHDLPAMAAAITDRTRVVLVCTPNNPTGPAVTQTELDAFLAAVPPHVLVVVDEAYIEFVRMADPVDGVATFRRHPQVVLTRTFSKAYGLAGLRVGYASPPSRWPPALRAVSLPFGVPHVAQVAAITSLRPPRRPARAGGGARRRARPACVAGLRDRGWDVPDAQGNFVWFDLGERTAAFTEHAEGLGITVRPFAGEGVRVDGRGAGGQRPAARAGRGAAPALSGSAPGRAEVLVVLQ